MYSKSQHLKSRRSVNDLFFGGPYGDSAHRHTTLPSSNCVRFGQDFCGDEGRYQSEHGAPKANML